MILRMRKFQQNINGIKDIKAADMPKKVVLVNKQFHEDFINWLSFKKLKAPDNLDTEKLFTEIQVKNDLKRGVDYEIISYHLWNDIIKQFGSQPKIEGILIKSPKNGEETILIPQKNCFTYSIYYPKKVPSTDFYTISMMPIQYYSHPDWLVEDVKKQICMNYGLDPSLFSFSIHNKNGRINEKKRMGEIHGISKNDLDIRQNKLNCMNKDADQNFRSLKMHRNPSNNSKTKPEKSPIEKIHPNLNDHRKSSLMPQPVGLNNIGNTCFFNAAVQCLARVMPLTQFFLSDNFTSQINPSNVKSSRGAIAHAYRRFLESLCGGSSSTPRNPTDLRSIFVTFYSNFANHEQHDSQEFLCSLLDALHEDLNQSAFRGGRLRPIEITSESDSWDVHVSRNSSPIVDTFHGILYSSIICTSCKHIEKVREPFVFLSIEIPRKFGSIKLQTCLQNFSRRESLGWRNKWRCGSCKKMVSPMKEIGVEKCGKKALIIHMKRFSGKGLFSLKIDTNVDYPDVLEASSFTKSDNGKFRLIGAVFHIGGLGYGHYTAAAIDPNTNEWYNFNDSVATRIDRSEAHKKDAYMLFYQRIE